MCDNDSLGDMIEYRLRSAGLSRRQFGALSLGAGVLSLLPPVAGAAAGATKPVLAVPIGGSS